MNWQDTSVADCGTHHLRQGKPLYSERFDEALSFHPPGLAAVRRAGGAWHIHQTGQPAYKRRFLRTFGFYQGRAAVVTEDGWGHILFSGEDLTSARYAWCGNFQGGRCAVREVNGAYLHIDLDGQPAYAQPWFYVGDYRDGIAVVQAENGRSTHVDLLGRPIHGQWFVDLDVFHKGYARARDDGGWMHVDRTGYAVYGRRFAMVEPFYNGYARAESFDGGLEVIDEGGRTIRQLRPPRRSEFAQLSADMVGYWRTETIGSAVELGVFDTVPGTAAEIAGRCALHPDRVERILGALGELELLGVDNGIWRLTGRGQYLRADHPASLAGAALEYRGRLGAIWRDLAASMRAQGDWQPVDIFAEVAADISGMRRHHEMLRSYALHDYPAVADALPLAGTETIIDAGGGLGVLAELLLRRHRDLHAIVLDRPEVVAQVVMEEALAARMCAMACDIIGPWPVTGDAVVLARVLHDWNDTKALAILKRATEALPPGGKLFVVEMILADAGHGGRLCDLHLLMACGGQERSLGEFQVLLAAAGLVFQEVRQVAALPSVIVAMKP